MCSDDHSAKYVGENIALQTCLQCYHGWGTVLMPNNKHLHSADIITDHNHAYKYTSFPVKLVTCFTIVTPFMGSVTEFCPLPFTSSATDFKYSMPYRGKV